MKRFLITSMCIIASMIMYAQMQVWSGGTIIFSHSAESVDSISFSSPVRAQVNANTVTDRPASLVGKTYYTDKYNSNYNRYDKEGYVFYSETECAYFYNYYVVDGYLVEHYTYNPVTGELQIGDDTAIVNDKSIALFGEDGKGQKYCTHVYFLY